MASIISAGTSTGTALNLTGDTSGILQFNVNNGTTALTIATTGVATFANQISSAVGIVGTTTTSGGYGLRVQADSANTYASLQFTNYAGSSDWGYLRSYGTNSFSITGSGGTSAVSVGIGTTTPNSSYSLDTTGTIRSQADIYTGFVNGSQAGLWLTRNNYASPAVQGVTSAGNAGALMLNPGGGYVSIYGTSAVRQITFCSSEMAIAQATAGTYLNISDATGSNGSSYTWTVRGLGSNGSAQASLNTINLVSSSVNVTGALSKGSGSFRIEHPLPSLSATHELVHSFIEGPRVDLIYRGEVSLVNGTATINIDKEAGMTEGTFEVLCREAQCFTSNESDWDAVKGSVTGNQLTITCQNTTSTAKVSWMVIAERKDPHIINTGWTDENGKVIIEPLKPTPQQGDLPFEGAK